MQGTEFFLPISSLLCCTYSTTAILSFFSPPTAAQADRQPSDLAAHPSTGAAAAAAASAVHRRLLPLRAAGSALADRNRREWGISGCRPEPTAASSAAGALQMTPLSSLCRHTSDRKQRWTGGWYFTVDKRPAEMAAALDNLGPQSTASLMHSSCHAYIPQPARAASAKTTPPVQCSHAPGLPSQARQC